MCVTSQPALGLGGCCCCCCCPGVRVSSGARARLCPGRQVYDYTIEQSRGPKRHLRSLFAIKSDGAASILIGLTTQCLESRYAELGPTYKAIISSFKS